MKQMKSYTFYLLLLSMLVFSCKNNQQEPQVEEPKNDAGFVVIDKQQFEAESMKMEKVQMHDFSESYKTTGKIITNYSSRAMVNPYISGKVKEIKVALNDLVKKGDVLFTIESEDYVELQKNYQITQAQLKPAKSNYLRQKKLFEDKISSEKEFLQAESEYKMLKAELDATLAKLSIIKIPVSTLEDGRILSTYSVYAPIDGQVQGLTKQIGEYVDPQDALLEIVNGEDALLEFVIYADFAQNIKKGQHLHFNTSVTQNFKYQAEVISVGQSMNANLQGVICQAKVLDDEAMIPGSKVILEVFYNNHIAPAVIHEAVIQNEDKSYLLVKSKEDDNDYYFTKTKVETGLVDSKYIEIKSPEISKEVLTNGAYYMNLED